MTLPLPISQLSRATFSLLSREPEAELLDLRERSATIRLKGKATVVLLAWEEDRAEAIAEELNERMVRQHAKHQLALGIVGGGSAARKVLESTRPRMTRSSVTKFHLSADGIVHNMGARRLQSALENLTAAADPSAEDWYRCLEQHSATLRENAAKTEESRHFHAIFAARSAPATLTLLVLLVLVFGLEAAFGGTQSPPVLLHLGALSPDRIREGEIWRLFSSTFLHSGFLHLAFNGYVLWVLGSFLEKIIGSWRLILLYSLSCLGASLLSLQFLDGFAVGASGGLWGFLGAHAVLAYRSGSLLPATMIPGAKKAALFNLGINVLNSFRPHVDMWAHFGGGAVGAILLLSGLLTRNLPRLDELGERRDVSETDTAIPNSPGLRIAAAALALLLLSSLGFAIAQGRPWTLGQPVAGVPTPLESLGIALPLPSGLTVTPSNTDEVRSVAVGDLIYDPGAVVVQIFSGDLSSEEILERERTALLEALKKLPEGAKVVSKPRMVVFGEPPASSQTRSLAESNGSKYLLRGKKGVSVRYSYGEVEEEVSFGFLPDGLVKVSSLHFAATAGAVEIGYTLRVLGQLQKLPLSSPTPSLDLPFRSLLERGTEP